MDRAPLFTQSFRVRLLTDYSPLGLASGAEVVVRRAQGETWIKDGIAVEVVPPAEPPVGADTTGPAVGPLRTTSAPQKAAPQKAAPKAPAPKKRKRGRPSKASQGR